ncbi:hypothetical protein F2P81_016237 [Scophthalmus maximus]|uniref:Uncharacterized protein n=1 Tax=Scophthalmus maximus TaxID=52904 RepID=A0A6A4SN27_SCOMX|nr:hypothetical protein F2P81_016237 [Scophthalmus maximus]
MHAAETTSGFTILIEEVHNSNYVEMRKDVRSSVLNNRRTGQQPVPQVAARTGIKKPQTVRLAAFSEPNQICRAQMGKMERTKQITSFGFDCCRM